MATKTNRAVKAPRKQARSSRQGILTSSKIVAFVPTKDASRARAFYEQALGLRFVIDDEFALVFTSTGTTIRVVKVAEFEPAPFTILGWEVLNIEKAVTALGARGVRFERFGFVKQDKQGIWLSPSGSKVAWFKDPDGNLLSVSQHP